ncbi:MAG: hypothetical protein Q7S43_00585 [bacterium]|nr:hypothetical protein [bacterium]
MRVDLLVVIGLVLISIPCILYFQVRLLTSTLLFFVIPTIFLLLRQRKQFKRLGASVIAGMVVAFTADFLAEFNGAWSWAPEGQLVFSNKLFGLIPVDVLIWYFFWITFTVVYYEHFFEHDRSRVVSRRFKSVLIFFLTLLAIIILTFYINPEILRFRYAYLWVAVFGSTPFFYLIFKKPHLIGKLLKAGIFNIFLFLSFELTALKLDQWRFPGEYIGTVSLFGVQFPFEEFIFWILLGTPIILSYYELYVDDGK